MRAVSRSLSLARHGMGATLEGLLVALLLTAILIALSPMVRAAGSAAGLRTTSAASTSWIALRGSAALAENGPSLGSRVAFDAGYPRTVKNPRIGVWCYQDGSLVYAEAGAVDATFELGGASSDWLRSGGAAACRADLFYFTYKGKVQSYHWLASTEFEAAA